MLSITLRQLDFACAIARHGGLTAAAAKQAAYRMRKRYRELFRLEVARTVADDSEVDDEIGRLLESLSE